MNDQVSMKILGLVYKIIRAEKGQKESIEDKNGKKTSNSLIKYFKN